MPRPHYEDELPFRDPDRPMTYAEKCDLIASAAHRVFPGIRDRYRNRLATRDVIQAALWDMVEGMRPLCPVQFRVEVDEESARFGTLKFNVFASREDEEAERERITRAPLPADYFFTPLEVPPKPQRLERAATVTLDGRTFIDALGMSEDLAHWRMPPGIQIEEALGYAKALRDVANYIRIRHKRAGT